MGDWEHHQTTTTTTLHRGPFEWGVWAGGSMAVLLEDDL